MLISYFHASINVYKPKPMRSTAPSLSGLLLNLYILINSGRKKEAMTSNKSILFVLALASLLPFIHVESRSLREEHKKKLYFTLEDFCYRTEFPDICTSEVRPYLNGRSVDAYSILEGGLKAIGDQTKKAGVEVEKFQKESKNKEKAKELEVCQAYYKIVEKSVERAIAALPVKDFTSLEYELANQVSVIRNCENLIAGSEFGSSNTPMDNINLALTMLAKNNLGMGNNLNNPDRP